MITFVEELIDFYKLISKSIKHNTPGTYREGVIGSFFVQLNCESPPWYVKH